MPTFAEACVAVASALLLIVAFPDFDWWWLAWFALTPLLVVIARRAEGWHGFLLGWLAGTIFFFGSCSWLTYSMIHYGGIPAPVAYLLLLIPTSFVALFPALAMGLTARAVSRWGLGAMILVAPLWTTFEWLRFIISGQLWNAVGYSQAFHPSLIQAGSWGGVHAVTFCIVAVNAALAYFVLRGRGGWKFSLGIIAAVACVMWLSHLASINFALVGTIPAPAETRAVIVAVQPNIAVDFKRPAAELARLTQFHLDLARTALRNHDATMQNTASVPSMNVPRLIVFPESPMNFAYARDASFREIVGDFARENHAAILFNSQEPAGFNGFFNSAVLVDANGFYVTQYDKIQLMPFGERIPLPSWMPGVSMIRTVVGEFTPGTKYSLFPIGDAARAGVFICLESAHPEIARYMTLNGADALVNITNDGYFGETAVRRQHLANSIFRAVENRRPLYRIANTGISAHINEHGHILSQTSSFESDARVWTVNMTDEVTGGTTNNTKTFYTRFGNLFMALNLFITMMVLFNTLRRRHQAIT